MKIAIHANGSGEIGMGHIMRTLVLAKELSKTNEIFYICRNKYKEGTKKLIENGFDVQLIRDEYLIEDMKNIKADILITDSYDVDEDYFNKTKDIFNRTVYIDDMNLHKFNVDILINQNINSLDFDYKTNKDTILLLGPQYIMLREEFRSAPKKIIKKEIKDIMITLGGGDPNHITEKLLEWSNELNYKFHVVIGPYFNNINQLKGYESKKIKLYENANMYELMKKSDMAISAFGSTIYELSTCRVPTIGIVFADNQEGVAIRLGDLGAVKSLGWYSEINKELFFKEVKSISEDYNLRKEMSERASTMIDGKGVERICIAIRKLDC